MDDAADVAQRIVDVAGAEAHAELVAAYYLRLRKVKVPPAAAHDFTVRAFFADTMSWEDDDG